MSRRSPSYTSTAKLLHWSMGSIWIGVWIVGALAVYFREELNPSHGLTFWHKAFASALLFLLVIRVAWRATHQPPAMPENISPPMRRLAHAGHFILYALALIALPISGWVWSSVADKPIMVLGLFKLPALVAPQPDAYDLAKWVHVIFAWSSAVLVLGHVAMALKHHWIDRDGVLLSMAPDFHRKKPLDR
ncbi:cytochrome b [Pseudomonas sp. Irchel s3a12]|uniref:cytochrome b n=1 Tax=Pseudomonas sp. Irchel s3a12 TaxID=2009047 RepID=UPI000BA36A9D|nr:cytochrome b [Pseudomonas sp. Irchel s3a12]